MSNQNKLWKLNKVICGDNLEELAKFPKERIKYPRYTRKQNLRCKLSEKDIKEIRQLYRENVPVIQISETFDVSAQAIYYWLLSDNRRTEKNKKQCLSQEEDIEDKRERQCKSTKRKYRLMPKFRKYAKQASRIRYLTNK